MGDSLHVRVLSTSHSEVPTSQLRLCGRPSLIVELRAGGAVFFGEASPLEGYGDDSFALAEQELRELRLNEVLAAIDLIFARNEATPEASTPLAMVSQLSEKFKSPAARFCVEMLVLQAVSHRLHVPVYRLISPRHAASPLRTSAVVDALSPAFEQSVSALMARQVDTFKIKCGRDDEAEIAAIDWLWKKWGTRVHIRLDANRAWSQDRALRFLARLKDVSLEFVEDPTQNVSEWAALLQAHPSFQLAIDEPLALTEPDESLLEESRAQVLVLKPMALGGFSVCLRWAAVAVSKGRSVCVSHLFDGPLALDACAQLAFAIQSPGIAPGLGDHAALKSYISQGISPPRCLKQDILHSGPPSTAAD